MRQIIHIQPTGCYIGRHQQLQMTLTKFLHHQITLSLTELTMQRIGVVTILNQFISNFLRFLSGPAKDNAINLGIKVYNPF
ncbi:unknown [Bacteroides sp. CAG:875]|nr:unknown [Bacteroides sp. CAG:875]